MIKYIFVLSLLFNMNVFAQEKIVNLSYANKEIAIPENCSTKSEFEIIDCNGFSAQWLYLTEEMVKKGVVEQLQFQIAQQIDFKKKKNIVFISQKQKFKGIQYELRNGTFRIIGFGRINEMPLILNLGFQKEPKNNADLSLFEKEFFSLD